LNPDTHQYYFRPFRDPLDRTWFKNVGVSSIYALGKWFTLEVPLLSGLDELLLWADSLVVERPGNCFFYLFSCDAIVRFFSTVFESVLVFRVILRELNCHME